VRPYLWAPPATLTKPQVQRMAELTGIPVLAIGNKADLFEEEFVVPEGETVTASGWVTSLVRIIFFTVMRNFELLDQLFDLFFHCRVFAFTQMYFKFECFVALISVFVLLLTTLMLIL
jgi:hypothetical protein